MTSLLNQIFLISTIAHIYLLYSCFTISDPVDKILLIIQELGLILDNFTLYLGVFLQPTKYLKYLNQIRFFLHMTVAPTLFFPIGNLFDEYSSLSKSFIFVVSIFFSIEGFFEFLRIQIIDSGDKNFTRYIRKPKASFKDIIPMITLNISTLILGSLIWFFKGNQLLFVTSLIMFLSASASEKLRFHSSNIGEIFFTYGIISLLKN
eukprot:gene11129-3948_t